MVRYCWRRLIALCLCPSIANSNARWQHSYSMKQNMSFTVQMELVEKNVKSDLRQLEWREGVIGGSETSNVVWVGDGGTEEKTGGGDGGGRVEDVTIFIRSHKNGQDQEWVHQRDRQHRWDSMESKHERQDWRGMDMYGGKMMGILRRMLRMELPGKRKRGRPKRRFMDVVKEDMAEVEVTEEDTEDRTNWRWQIRCGDPWGKSRKKKKVLYLKYN